MKNRIVAVSDLCQQIRGVSYKGGEAIDAPQEGYLPILRANNICDGEISYDDLVFVPQKYVSKTQVLQKNDVVIAASSGSIEIVGKAAQIKDDFKGSFGAFCKVLRPNSDVDPAYLSYFFKTPFYRHTISHLAAGANINNLRNEHLDNLRIPLPSFEIQRKKVAFLSKTESALEKRRQTIRLADEFLKSAFLEMFGDPQKQTSKWPLIKGRELFVFSSGKFNPTKNLNDMYPYPTYGGNGIIGYSRDFLIDYDTLAIGRVGAYCGSVHRTQGKIWVTDNAIFIKEFKKKMDLDFLYYLFHFLQLNRFSSQSGQPKITQQPLDNLDIPLVPIDVQQKFAGLVQKVEKLKGKQKQSETQLQNLFNSLMQRAFKGELK